MLPNQRWESVRWLNITNWSKVSNFGETHLSDWHQQSNSRQCLQTKLFNKVDGSRYIQENESAAHTEFSALVGLAILECPVWSLPQYSNFQSWWGWGWHMNVVMTVMRKRLDKLVNWPIGSTRPTHICRQAWQLKSSISLDVFINPTSTKNFMHHWHWKQHSKRYNIKHVPDFMTLACQVCSQL